MGFRFAVQLLRPFVSQLLRPFVADETREARLPSRERREATGGDPHFSSTFLRSRETPTIYFRFDFCAGVDAPRFSVG